MRSDPSNPRKHFDNRGAAADHILKRAFTSISCSRALVRWRRCASTIKRLTRSRSAVMIQACSGSRMRPCGSLHRRFARVVGGHQHDVDGGSNPPLVRALRDRKGRHDEIGQDDLGVFAKDDFEALFGSEAVKMFRPSRTSAAERSSRLPGLSSMMTRETFGEADAGELIGVLAFCRSLTPSPRLSLHRPDSYDSRTLSLRCSHRMKADFTQTLRTLFPQARSSDSFFRGLRKYAAAPALSAAFSSSSTDISGSESRKFPGFAGDCAKRSSRCRPAVQIQSNGVRFQFPGARYAFPGIPCHFHVNPEAADSCALVPGPTVRLPRSVQRVVLAYRRDAQAS